jgi:hypothetical protein
MWGSLTSKVISKIINIIVFYYALDISKKKDRNSRFFVVTKNESSS